MCGKVSDENQEQWISNNSYMKIGKSASETLALLTLAGSLMNML
jgi:hypothetical protein